MHDDDTGHSVPAHRVADEAERLAGLGVATIPTRVGSKAAACRWRRFYNGERLDADERRRLFGRPGVGGLAVLLGSPSAGLACRDFDDPAAFESWCEESPTLAAELPTVRTARGGHVYFRAPEGLGGCRTLGDGELRLGRCYTLLPPSVHPSGRRYEWLRRLDALPRVLDPSEAGLAEAAMLHSKTQQYAAKRSHEGGEKQPINAQNVLDDAIARTLPQRVGERNNALWRFARELRVFLPADADRDVLKPLARAWWQRARPFIGTREWAETWLDFERAFRRVVVPADAGVLRVAIERAGETEPPERLASEFSDSPRLLRLACLCASLAAMGGGRFFLSCRDAGRAVGASHTQASRLLGLLCDEGVLERLDPGTRGSGGRASTYRWRLAPETTAAPADTTPSPAETERA